MADVPAILDSIRKRFVGTGEEHDLLKSIFDNYLSGWSQGRDAAMEQLESARESLDNASRFALFISENNYDLRVFCDSVSATETPEDYDVAHAVEFLQSCKGRSDRLRELADALEKAEATP